MAQIKYELADAKRRGIDGVCRVCVADDSMECRIYAYAVVIDWVTPAVAKSIVRHMNKQVPMGMDVHYYTEDRDRLEPDLSHWA